MSPGETPPDNDWPASTAAGTARRAALKSLPATPEPRGLVSYHSAGELLIIGTGAMVRDAVPRLGDGLRVTQLVPESGDPDRADNDMRVYHAALRRVEGHLGDFEVVVTVDGSELNLAETVLKGRRRFDLILDLGAPPALERAVLPPGYYAPRDSAGLESAVTELRDLVGEFEKPRYFEYDADICAHGRSGLTGCTRCLEACPTEAITSLRDRIEVNPFLCQGAGGCATACPTGAITYAYPTVPALARALKRVIREYRELDPTRPTILFHDRENGSDLAAAAAAVLPESALPVAVEEVAAIGLDTWLAALAFGAGAVWVLCHDAVPPSSRREIENQMSIAGALLSAMGYSPDCLRSWNGDPGRLPDPVSAVGAINAVAAGFNATQDKRATLRFAIDHLVDSATARPESVSLPAASPFGEIRVDRDTCTLCMACVAVCPATALEAGGDSPRLGFIEWNCVQCGLCEKACPEDSISLIPRFLFGTDARMRSRVLNEDPPFHCIRCGKPFATRKIMERMEEKLRGHWMFQKPGTMDRLRMCEDCRVTDLYTAEGGLAVPRKP